MKTADINTLTRSVIAKFQAGQRPADPLTLSLKELVDDQVARLRAEGQAAWAALPADEQDRLLTHSRLNLQVHEAAHATLALLVGWKVFGAELGAEPKTSFSAPTPRTRGEWSLTAAVAAIGLAADRTLGSRSVALTAAGYDQVVRHQSRSDVTAATAALEQVCRLSGESRTIDPGDVDRLVDRLGDVVLGDKYVRRAVEYVVEMLARDGVIDGHGVAKQVDLAFVEDASERVRRIRMLCRGTVLESLGLGQVQPEAREPWLFSPATASA